MVTESMKIYRAAHQIALDIEQRTCKETYRFLATRTSDLTIRPADLKTWHTTAVFK